MFRPVWRCSRGTSGLSRNRMSAKTRSSSSSSIDDDEGQVYSEQRMLGYSAEKMFQVVSQVEHYHGFVPWCQRSDVVWRSPPNGLRAELVIGFPPFIGESYTSQVTLIKPYLVTATSKDMRLFKHLKTVWKFSPSRSNPETCQLDFAVSFCFASGVHEFISRRFRDEVVVKNIEAFLSEAQRRFGPPEKNVPRKRMVLKNDM